MILLNELTSYLDEILELDKFSGDSSNNGLQVEGNSEVRKLLFAVDASLELFNVATEKNADFLFVHHGISWGSNLKRLTSMVGNRVRALFSNNMSLYAAHLPLDAHPEYGHNAQLAHMLNLQNIEEFGHYSGCTIGFQGQLPKAVNARELNDFLTSKIGSNHTIYGDDARNINRVGIISGGAGDMVDQAIKCQLDCFITGEVTHSAYHTVKESGLTVLALGHYSSEKPGVLAVMNHLSNLFDIDCEFIDIPTGL